MGVHVVTTTVTAKIGTVVTITNALTAMIKTVVTIMNTVTVITMTANTVDREGLQMKRIKIKKSGMIRSWFEM